MATTQYIGSRYVPVFANPIDWDNTKAYEPLTIVTHEGNSYTSRQYVPTGIDISNTDYWALTANYNAQIEQYRREVKAFDDRITTNTTSNTAQDKQLAGTSDSGLKTLIDANTSTNATHTNQLAGTSDSGLKTLIENNNYNSNMIFAFGQGSTQTTKTCIYFSKDGKNFNFSDIQFPTTSPKKAIWSKNIGEIKDTAYFFEDYLNYFYTNDFKTFNSSQWPVNSVVGLWSLNFIQDNEKNGYAIACYSTNYTADTKNAVGSTTYGDFKIIITPVTQNSDGSIAKLPNPNTWTILTPNVNSAIDPSIAYYRGNYYLAFKDEINCTINIYKSSAIAGPYTNTNITIPIYGIEAPYLIANNTSLYLYADGYDMYPITKNNAINDSNFYSRDAIYWSSCLFRLYYYDTKFSNQKAYPVLLPQTPHFAYHIFTSNKLLMALANVSGVPVTYNFTNIVQ